MQRVCARGSTTVAISRALPVRMPAARVPEAAFASSGSRFSNRPEKSLANARLFY
jgi:hypothetical protein